MKRAEEILPWKVTDISLRPYKDFWSMNPSIHFDGETWRCVLRCCDYCMRGGVTVRSRKAGGGVRTKNALVIFDPNRWRPIEIYKMRERDDLARSQSDNVGYEDIRIFRTEWGGLQGIAASQHLRRRSGGLLSEQVLLSFDDRYDIVEAQPIRGGFWSDLPQKNWVPFDCCVDPRFLYSIVRGTLFNERGELHASDARVRLSRMGPVSTAGSEKDVRRALERAHECEEDRARRKPEHGRQPSFGNVDPVPGYDALRGGTQLVRVGDDAWLGIGHAMKFVDKLKYYFHVWYLVDSRGVMQSASPPMKLAPNGIEFAAGIALDGERVVVSFGVDDMEAKIGETRLSAVMEMLKPIARPS